MTNLIINKDGTLYTLPDSVSCGTVNGVDIKEIEVNNNGSLVTVWKLQSDVSVTVYAKYIDDGDAIVCSYWLGCNDKYYPITDKKSFKCLQIFTTYEGSLFATIGGSSTAQPTVKQLEMILDNSICGFSYTTSLSQTKYYTPAGSSSNNFFFSNTLNSISRFPLKRTGLESATTLTEVKNLLTSSSNRYNLGTFTITGEQFYQATGVNP